jgi:amidase
MSLIENSYKLAEKIGQKDGLNCIAALDPSVLTLDDKAEYSDSSLPLYGVPILVKDNIDVKGLPTTAGSLALSDNIAKDDAPVIKNLRKNGAVIIGKTNMTEFANFVDPSMPNGYSSYGGQVIHAINKDVDPSGSSTGSAVAVSAGIVPMAVGTDTSFSVIACAMFNGICGLKPPVGILSNKGIVPIARTLDSAGAMAATFSDALKLYCCMKDKPMEPIEAADPKKLKIAINYANFEPLSDEQKKFFNSIISMLKVNSCNIGTVTQEKAPLLKTIMKYEFKPCLEEYLKYSNSRIKTLKDIVEYYESNPDTMMKYGCGLLKEALLETEGGLESPEYIETMEEREKTIKAVTKEIEDFDAVIMTGPTNIMHFCGLPSVTVASKTKDEKGINRAIVMYGVDERKLYSAALTIEKLIQTERM